MPRTVTKDEKFERFEEDDPIPRVQQLIKEGHVHICLNYWYTTKKWTIVVPKLKRPEW